ncbi:hypothetical protein GRI44_09345 [Altererythrobacter confluentis]|uniref:Uncharacterized protein n=1 Tax=Allopontixanthobacter confluentis TaxID=1849021 RepID=A0A6L7GGA9_9SPHN|nr:hypothetical protein [Allopontixanthobacter confluentis]MXP14949.1 hypothetical protein [Allopontixanthobacter confluentis]
MRFWGGLKYTYRESWAFLWACPLLALIPVLAEFAQHAAEMHLGMYASLEAAQAAEDDPLRMAFGFIKTFALSLPGYWVIRYLAGNRDTQAARSFDRRSVTLYAVVMLFNSALVAIQLFVLPRSGAALIAGMVGGLLITPLLLRWFVAAPLGIFISPAASARVMLPQVPFAIAFSLAVMLPLMVPHYALGAAAIFAPAYVLKWAILIADSLLVGWMAAAMMAGSWALATRKMPITA